MQKQINIGDIQLKTKDNVEFFGEHNNKKFKITKELDQNYQEFQFTLDIMEKDKTVYKVNGTYTSMDEC